MKQIWVVKFGEEYSHSDNVAAFVDKDKAMAEAEKLAKEKNLPWVGSEDWGWYDGLLFIKVDQVDYYE